LDRPTQAALDFVLSHQLMAPDIRPQHSKQHPGWKGPGPDFASHSRVNQSAQAPLHQADIKLVNVSWITHSQKNITIGLQTCQGIVAVMLHNLDSQN
jgi:hypothetical protein